MPLDVRQSPELQACIIAMRDAERTVRNDINATARRELTPVWQEALRAHVTTRLEARTLLPGAKVKVTARQITLVAAGSRRPLKGGLVPDREWPAVEFGAARKRKTIETHSRKGKPYRATRTQGAQFRTRNKRGHVVMPAAAVAGHRIVAGWVQLVIAGFEQAFEIKAGQ